MPRRYRPEKRVVDPDLRYNSVNVSMFVNRLMRSGKKSTAQRILYDSFDIIEGRLKRPPLEIFDQALHNIMPHIEVKPRRVGGATYQVPMPVEPERQVSLGMRWLLTAARNRGGRSMAEKLAAELMDAANNQGAAVKRRDDTHRMAEANRAFSHFSRF
ncbi:MAG: 30S ribosomal protein S7 [Chloroflexi bacterium]|nr:30S ribosomal protein S7 [Chloroflexota bacterium]MBK6710373.1 30S ribosomal protein S7 [Chloroflexota bacterium]MBK7180081.1 30S ribosomal protein S7 [Chloroflexota bacterium]MBK7917704.1 30S ribosomal protein S7 [Chloroflexota bacterium]MBK8934765.1 30S ribosomal protein S7 [Chloroflexota bacterium]